LSELISSWAAGNPRVRRVWLSEEAGAGERIGVMVELQPVGDSEETMAVWMAHCDGWRADLKARVGEPVDLDWYDPDTETPAPPASHDGKTLVYERMK
jgi:hypothetical protein